jgi:uncharacterized protein involved in exopolysaccharide biosynthesis
MESSLTPPNDVGKSVLLTRILHAYFKRRISSTLIFLVTLVAVLFMTFLTAPRWKGVAYVTPEGGPRGQWGIFDDLYSPSPVSPIDVTVQGLIAILNSNSVASEVVEEFELDARLQQKKEDPAGPRDKAKKAIMDVVMSPVQFLRDRGILTGETSWPDKAMKDFQDDWLEVDVVEGTQVIAIGVNAESIEFAREMPGRLVEILDERLAEFRRSELRDQHAVLAGEITAVESELEEKRAALQMLKADKGVLDLSEMQVTRIRQLEDLKMQQALAENEVGVLEKRLEVMTATVEGGPGTQLTATTEEANPTLRMLRDQLEKLEVERAGLVVRRAEGDLSVRTLESRIEETTRRIAEEQTLVLQSRTHSIDPSYLEMVTRRATTEADLEGARARATGFVAIVAELSGELATMTADELMFVRLQSRIDVLEEIAGGLWKKKREMEALLESAPGGVLLRHTPAVVFDNAKADWPKWGFSGFVALVLALVLALAWPLWAEYWRDAFVTASEAEQVLRLPVLGCLPPLGMSARAVKRRSGALGHPKVGPPIRRVTAGVLARGGARRGATLLCYPDSGFDARLLPSVFGPALADFAAKRPTCLFTNRKILEDANCPFTDLGNLDEWLEGDGIPGPGEGLNVVHVEDPVEITFADPEGLDRCLGDLATDCQLVMMGPIESGHPLGQLAARMGGGIVWALESDSTRRPRAVAAMEKLDPDRTHSLGAILVDHRRRIPRFLSRWFHLGEVS